MAEAEGRIPTQSLAGALVDSYYIIDTVLETTADQGAKLTNFDRIKSAFELGHTGRKESLCDQVFSCETKNIDIALPSVSRSQQVDCSDLAQVCPGVSQSVSLSPSLSCKHFSPSSPSPARCADCSCPGPVPPPVPWRVSSVAAPDIFASWQPATRPPPRPPGSSTSRSRRRPGSQGTLTPSLKTSCVWPEILTAAGKDLYYQHVNSCKAFQFNKRSTEILLKTPTVFVLYKLIILERAFLQSCRHVLLHGRVTK